MDAPFIAELNPTDEKILYTMRLERFYSNLLNPHWYRVKINGTRMHLYALNCQAAKDAISVFDELVETSLIILGTNSVCLYNSAYTKLKESLLVEEVFTMQSTLEKEQVSTSQTLNISSASTNTEYISLPQLREMAVALSGENEEFIGWLEANELNIPMRFISGAPYFQKKAIAKAAEQWNNSKISGVLSRFLGMSDLRPGRADISTTPDKNGTKTARIVENRELKNLRTPPGFKPVKTGKDKYARTVQALAEKINKDKWGEYLTHITELDSLGEPFVKRLAANYNDKDAFAKLHEAFMEYASGNAAIAPTAA